jgi:GNAT superfamily N-acetyltransferase
MATACSISLHTEPDPNDVQAVKNGLAAYNLLHAPPYNTQRLVLFLRAGDGTLHGGLLGLTWWGWLRVDILWIDEALRHEGWGSRLLEAAEQEAIRRGCHFVFLDTMSFQALPFYLKRGYRVFGQLDDLPEGHVMYFLQKKLESSGPEITSTTP